MNTPLPATSFIVFRALLVAQFSLALPAFAAPGDLDASFGAGGMVTTSFGSNATAQGVAMQSDGKIVVVGYSGSDFVLVRYNTDGSLDNSFGAGGRVATDMGSNDDRAYSVAVQGDGRIVVVGSRSSPGFAVARYNPDGSLDTTFNGIGKVTTNVGGVAAARSVAVQGDGKIVVAGVGGFGGEGDFAVARFTSAGALDTSFSSDGIVTTDIGSSTPDTAYSVAVQGNGGIVVAGVTGALPGNPDFALVRYTSTGALDSTFNGGGKVVTAIGSGRDEAYSVAVQSDGRIVAAGLSYNLSNNDFALVRYTSTGALDLTFNGTGKVTTPIGDSDDIAYGVAVQTDGKIVAAGQSSYDFALARYNADGSLDTTFNDSGKVTTPIGSGFIANDAAHSVAVQSDGQIVAAGFAEIDHYFRAGFALARYTSTGALDTGFNSSGMVVTFLGGSNDVGYGALQSDGRIVVAGYSDRGATFGGSDFALARYDADGHLDTTLGGTGKVRTDLGSGGLGGETDDFGRSVVVQSDGRILVAGSSRTVAGTGGSYDFALVRYHADGSLDTTFNATGKVTTELGGADFGRSLAVQGDGKIVVAGYSNNGGSGDDFALVRYHANGSLDTSFNGTGKVITPIGSAFAPDIAYSVAVQNDGRILVAGSSFMSSSGNDFALVRYNVDGSLDTTFNGTGKVTTPIGSGGADDEAFSVVVQSDGKILVTGYSETGAGVESLDVALVRYHANGSLDTSFNTTGKVTTAIGSSEDAGRSVVLQSDGKILVTGWSWNGANYDVALLRYTNTGALDINFGGGTGIVTTAVGPSSEFGLTVALQSDGRIVLAGAERLVGEDFAVLRYEGDPPIPPEINLTGNGMTIADGDAIPSTADGTVFENTHVNGGAVSHPFTIQNTGAGPLQLSAPTAVVSGPHATDFSVSIAPPTLIAAGGAATFFVRFDPGTTGLRSATITIVSNDGDEAPYEFAVQGTGILLPGELDPTFDEDGKVTADVASDAAASVALQIDGRIVVVGTASNASVSEFAVVRFTNTGVLDMSFNGTGKVTTDLASGEDAPRSVVVQSDGRIVVAGYSFNGSKYNFALVRHTNTGALDTTFNGTGIVITDFGNNLDIGQSVALQNDGKIVVAGHSGADYAVARYNADGSLDSTFSGDGRQTTNISGSDAARSVAVQSDGKIVLAGYSDPPGGLTPPVFSLARYNVDGSLDTSFNGTGRVTTSVGGMHSRGASMAIQCDGKIVVVGSAGAEEGGGSLAIVRYTPAGALDTSFNGTGIVIDDFGGQLLMEASSVAVQADGKIVVAGTSNLDFALVRYASGGGLDLGPIITNISTMGSGGNTQTSNDTGSGVAIQSDGKIVLAGTSAFPTGSSDFALVRYASDTPRQMFDNAAAAAGLTGPAAGPASIPFHDGIDNLSKFAFDLDLAGPDARTLQPGGSAGLPFAKMLSAGGQTFWQVEFVRRKGSGLIYTPLKSAALESGSFVPMTGDTTVQNIDARFERVIVSEPLDPATAGRIFSHVQVTLP